MIDWLLNLFFGPPAPDVSPQEAYRLHFEEDKPTLILDVRQPAEYSAGTIPGAMRIPLTQVGARLEEIPRDREVLAICQSSHRSPIAARRLRKAGYDVLNIAGGMNAWEAAALPME
jgi:rhodanese-related sulfurtransferase